MKNPESRNTRPRFVPEYAAECLQALAAEGLGAVVSVGGGIGLLQYIDYRPTHDLDLWWNPEATPEEKKRVLDTADRVLRAQGEVRRRQWGDVVSIELSVDGRAVFSFQVAARDTMLRSPAPLGWVGVMSDSLDDLIASKMTALIERGAPRDLRDIHAICAAGLAVPSECWRLWAQRSKAAGAEPDTERAVLAIQTHLARIARMRPLDSIPDQTQRSEAQSLRIWFSDEFLPAAAEAGS